MPRFDADRSAGTHLVLALTVIIAVVAIGVGIKDYVQQKKANPPASTATPTALDLNVKTPRKSITSAKTTQARISLSEANALPTPQGVADNMERALIRQCQRWLEPNIAAPTAADPKDIIRALGIP